LLRLRFGDPRLEQCKLRLRIAQIACELRLRLALRSHCRLDAGKTLRDFRPQLLLGAPGVEPYGERRGERDERNADPEPARRTWMSGSPERG